MNDDVPRKSGPQVSVLVPVYNGSATLARAVRAVMEQTLTDFELIVIDDGSSDGSLDRLKPWEHDERLRVFTNAQNLGLVATLNRGIGLSRAPLIARLDQDDWSAPTRLERQAEAFDDERVVLCASAYRRMSPDGTVVRVAQPPKNHAELAASMLLGNRVQHSSVMFRREAAIAAGLYDFSWDLAEDYDLWLKLLELGEYRCLSSVESTYVISPDGISSKRAERQASVAAARAAAYRARLAGTDPSTDRSRNGLVREISRAAAGLRTELRRRGIDETGVDRMALRSANGALRDDSALLRALKIVVIAPRLALIGRIRRGLGAETPGARHG